MDFARRELRVLSERLLRNPMLFKSEVDREKKAFSEAEVKPETNNSRIAESNAISAKKEEEFTVTPLKTVANWHKNVSGSKEFNFS